MEKKASYMVVLVKNAKSQMLIEIVVTLNIAEHI